MTDQIEISKKLKTKLIEACENADLGIYWDQGDQLSKDQISNILENGFDDFESELWEHNLDYISDSEDYYLKNNLYEEFEAELTEEFIKFYPEEEESFIETEIQDYLYENFRDYLSFDLNANEVLKRTGNINCLIKVYSNYDCCNSFDKLEDEGYIKEVYRRVHKGVHLRDYMYEFYNGAYGGSLFCFAFSTSLDEIIKLKKQIKTGENILIPKGTQFGFFSDFQGAGSVFEKTTYKDFQLPITEKGLSKYDCSDILADCEQSYSMEQVYGGIDLTEQNVEIQ